jgi:glycosyltransferase involved in cell wall biosynthesis
MTIHITYLTTDSISEGVGASQIIPLICRLAKKDFKVHLISLEKVETKSEVFEKLSEHGITWSRLDFGVNGSLGGLRRLFRLKNAIGVTDLIHARSDISALAGLISGKAPVLWDVRSLWADQRRFIERNYVRKAIFIAAKPLESICSTFSKGMSTLTEAVVPVLEARHCKVPEMRVVVPTAVDLERFAYNNEFPKVLRGLYSGTYNDYYDLVASFAFISAVRSFAKIEIHWARPRESNLATLNAGETHTFESSYMQMPTIISQFSFGISICKQNAGPSLKAAVPTKIAEFLACGRPVVVSKGIGDLDFFLTEFKAGVVIDTQSDDFGSKAKELLDLLKDPETPRRCRELAKKYFDIDTGVDTYTKLYSRMII